MAQKPYIVWSVGPKALIYESLEPLGWDFRTSFCGLEV